MGRPKPLSGNWKQSASPLSSRKQSWPCIGRATWSYDATRHRTSSFSSSTTYPDASFGYMGDTVALGYQAAMVSLHSPTYGCLWPSSQLHGGDTVSSTQTQSLVEAAEMRTGLRPRRRTELVATRLARAENAFASAEAGYWESNDKQKYAQDKARVRSPRFGRSATTRAGTGKRVCRFGTTANRPLQTYTGQTQGGYL